MITETLRRRADLIASPNVAAISKYKTDFGPALIELRIDTEDLAGGNARAHWKAVAQ